MKRKMKTREIEGEIIGDAKRKGKNLNSQNYINIISIVQQLKGGEIKLEHLHRELGENNKKQEQKPQTLMSIGRKQSCEMIESHNFRLSPFSF